MTEIHDNEKRLRGKPYYWLIYIAAILSGLLLLADAAAYGPATKITARLGIAILYTAFALWLGRSCPTAWIGTILVWTAVLLTFLL